MFAIVDSEGRLYLRADASTAMAFEAAGSTQHARMPYWEVPEPVRGTRSNYASGPPRRPRWLPGAVARPGLFPRLGRRRYSGGSVGSSCWSALSMVGASGAVWP